MYFLYKGRSYFQRKGKSKSRSTHTGQILVIGSLISYYDGDGNENVTMLKSELALLQTLSRALIPSRSVLQMLANFPAKFRKRKRKSLSWVHVLHKTWNQAFSRSIFVQWRQINVQKSGIHVQTAKVLRSSSYSLKHQNNTPQRTLALPAARV